jgi:release factor glutamine methyltransferase
MTTLSQTVLTARHLDRLDAQLLLLHALGRPLHDRAWLLAHDTDTLPPEVLARFDACVQRRLAGEPLAYITGHKEFFGLDLQVDARVLVPRPDTETLVEWALEIVPASAVHPERVEVQSRPFSIIDLGTGSGAIALALKHTRPDLQVSAVDASADALAVARTNAQRLGLKVAFVQGSWLGPVRGKFDLIVSNPPYIAAQDSHLDALRHEPLQALASGNDGLDDIRQIVGQARAHLQPGGWLLLEHGYDQAEQVRRLLRDAGFDSVQSRRDLNGIERCSGGISPT